MSNDKTEVLPTTAAAVPTRRPILRAASAQTGRPASTFAGWRGQAQTEKLPTIEARPALAPPRVSTLPEPASGRVARHLRSALAAIALAAAILIPMQLFAAHGISSARQAALAASQRDAAQAAEQAEQAAPAPVVQPDVRSDIQPDWVTEGAGAAYDRTDPHSSPLDLPRCTTSPDTPLPCLATISPDSRRAVVLEEDASPTAVVRR